MHLLGKHIDKLESEDITNLIENGVAESIKLDYKQELPDLKEKTQKLKWLALISSFANKDGGLIVYGIGEKLDNDGKNTGMPEEVKDLGSPNFDDLQLQMQQVLNAGLDPKLPTPKFKEMEIDGKKIFLIGIQRSLFAPHVVWFEKSGKFWVRNNNGKEQMDVHQLRRSFLQSEEWEKEADNFRRKRIMEVRSGEFIPNLNTVGSFFVHILPLGQRDSRVSFKGVKYNREMPYYAHLPNISSGVKERHNLHGYLFHHSANHPTSYVQYFRNGGVELYTCNVIYKSETYEQDIVDGVELERVTKEFVQNCVRWYTGLSVEPPLMIYMSLHDADGLPLCYGSSEHPRWDTNPKTIEGEQILLPGVVVEDWSSDVRALLKVPFDVLANCGGWASSHSATF